MSTKAWELRAIIQEALETEAVAGDSFIRLYGQLDRLGILLNRIDIKELREQQSGIRHHMDELIKLDAHLRETKQLLEEVQARL